MDSKSTNDDDNNNNNAASHRTGTAKATEATWLASAAAAFSRAAQALRIQQETVVTAATSVHPPGSALPASRRTAAHQWLALRGRRFGSMVQKHCPHPAVCASTLDAATISMSLHTTTICPSALVLVSPRTMHCFASTAFLPSCSKKLYTHWVTLLYISRTAWLSRERGTTSPPQTECGSAHVHQSGRRASCCPQL